MAIDLHMIGIMSLSTILVCLHKMVYWIDLKKYGNACTAIKRDNNIRRTVCNDFLPSPSGGAVSRPM